ncbi:MAG: hypothetical protein ABS56_10840 [Lautropia sp. SCN 69-89]|nr:MAG: hypothetical protein ABS56_10840 [Lautropia sp. SCN 69-89]
MPNSALKTPPTVPSGAAHAGAIRERPGRTSRLQPANASTNRPSSSSNARSGAFTSNVTPSTIPVSMNGTSRSSSPRSTDLRLRTPIAMPPTRS